MTLRCLIVEDEPLARERLTGYLARTPQLQLAGVVDNGPEALSLLRQIPVELLFLDVNLGGMSGIELLETAKVECPVILTTAHPEHALKAYDLKVVDYLLKPFTFERFKQAVERVSQSAAHVFIKSGARLERVTLSEILYIEGQDDYRCIHTRHKQILTSETFGELEKRLPVCRVHRSYAVALDKIDSIERDRVRIGEKLIPISASYRDALHSLLSSRR
jgi:two-component system LytT family response regulator